MSETEVVEGTAVTIDGKAITAKPGELLIDAAERTGTYIPRFCYHNRLEPVGMCRMCIVEVDTGRGPALQPSCMIECSPDMVVDTKSEITKKAQDGILEFLLINHPLDCPVCDKGGECPLQDQTMSFGPGETRMVEEKRHFTKPIPISETVYLDRERCILCDRCTRFASDVAGDPLIHFMSRGNQSQVNTFPNEPFSSYFSGNTVQICPVGALTAKPYRFKARPWDLDESSSTCTTCSVGCAITVQSSRDRVLRYQGVDIDPVNWGWLCDKGRFGFEAVNSEDRLGSAFVRDGDDLVETSWSAATTAAGNALRAALDDRGPSSIGVIGGARLTNEDQYAWAKFAKGVLGTDNVDAQLGDGLPAELVHSLPRATIDEVCAPGGTVVYLGPDPKEALGVLYIRLRHAAVKDGVKIIELAPQQTGLSPYAAVTLFPLPGDAGKVVASLISEDVGGPAVGASQPDAVSVARELLKGGPVTVVLGRPSLAEDASVIAEAAAALAKIDGVRFLSALPRGNVHGALDMGLAPGMLPGRVALDAGTPDTWATAPTERGLDTAGMLEAAADGKIDVLVLLGADPLSDFPDRDLAQRALDQVNTIIALDQFATDSARAADVLFGVAGAAEVDGTTTNLEGRVSFVRRKVTAPGTVRSDWMIASELARHLDADLGLDSVDAIFDEIIAVAPSHAALADGALTGVPEGIIPSADATLTYDVAPVPAPEAGSLRLVVSHRMYDTGTMLQACESSSGLAPDAVAAVHSAEIARLGLGGIADVRITSASGSVELPLAADDGVPPGAVSIDRGLRGGDAGHLVRSGDLVTTVSVEALR